MDVEIDLGPDIAGFRAEMREWITANAPAGLEDVAGTASMGRPDGPGHATDDGQDVLLSSRVGTIYPGTSEIQRNIIGERARGLPKEPSAERRA